MIIPFDIKYRPEIESGRCKVETQDGRSVTILTFNAKNPNYPIIGLVNTNGVERPYSWAPTGRYCINRNVVGDTVDLVIVFDVPEDKEAVIKLNEFEEYLKDLVNSHAISKCRIDEPKVIRHYARELMCKMLTCMSEWVSYGIESNE